MVTVRLFAAARAAAGQDSVEVSPGTLAEVLTEVIGRHPDLGAVVPRCSFLLDEVAVHGDHVSIDVPEGSVLDVLPPFAGG